jgi:hypothetical protein
MTRRLLAALATISLVCGLVGCSEGGLYGFKLDAAQVNGPGTLGLSQRGQPVKGLIVYFHGSDQNAQVTQVDRKHTDFFDPLLRSGYAVVSADAEGNAFGNPASRHDYRQLIAAAQQKYVAEPLFFVAESMGALPASALISEDTGRQVKGMVGISPLMGLPPDTRSVSFIAGPWGGQVPDRADPLSWPPEAFSDRSFRLYAPKDDKVIPANASARAFADHFGSVAKIAVIDCDGGHVAAACYQGADVVKWMAHLG